MAAVRDGELTDYAIDRDCAVSVGDVFRGRVTARARALAGSFLALGEGLHGFLPDSAGGAALADGDSVMVEVVRAPQGGKGPRLAVLTDNAPGSPGRLARGPSAVVRLAALHPEATVLVDDPLLAAELRPALGQRLERVGEAFDDSIEAQVAALSETEVALAGGGRLRIEPTASLVAIDVDLGGGAARRESKTRAHRQANLDALPEIARQIRLRNLGGAILLDLAGLSPSRRAALAAPLQAVLDGDPVGARLLGFSALGFAEILRTRRHAPLHELVRGAEAAALAALRAVMREVASRPDRKPVLRSGAGVADALAADEAARKSLARRCGRSLILRVDRALPPLAWHVEES